MIQCINNITEGYAKPIMHYELRIMHNLSAYFDL